MLYTVFSLDSRIGKYCSLDEAKICCLENFEKCGKSFSRYEIKVYNPDKNRVTRTHYVRCSYIYFAGMKLKKIFLDYGK